jgi:hypothetical protein
VWFHPKLTCPSATFASKWARTKNIALSDRKAFLNWKLWLVVDVKKSGTFWHFLALFERSPPRTAPALSDPLAAGAPSKLAGTITDTERKTKVEPDT